MSFIFKTSPNIVSQIGASRNIGNLLKQRNINRTLIITDNQLLKLGLQSDLQSSLKENNIEFQIYSDVQPDPILETIPEIKEKYTPFNPDCVIGFGGGSSMDVAKIVSYFLKNQDQTIDDVVGVGNCRQSRLPLVQIPTTAGTGSEVTGISILKEISNNGAKKAVSDGALLPDIAVLDGNLTLKLPKYQTAITGIDAMVHAIEAYTNKRFKNVLSDSLAITGLQIMGQHIEKAVFEPNNAESRQQMLVGSLLAGQAFNNSPVGAVHALAYPLACIYNIPHGHSNSLMLPSVINFNYQSAPKEYDEIYKAIFPQKYEQIVDKTNLDLSGELLKMSQNFDLKYRLRDVGVKENEIETLAIESMKQERLLPNNPREVTLEDARNIFSEAY